MHRKSNGLDNGDRSSARREKLVEQALVKETRQSGGMCPKLVSPGTDGMPDRLVLLPEGRMGFVEVKAPGKKPRPLQQKRHEQLRELGYTVAVLDDPQQIPEILDEIRR
jgi:hypothetical protein